MGRYHKIKGVIITNMITGSSSHIQIGYSYISNKDIPFFGRDQKKSGQEHKTFSIWASWICFQDGHGNITNL